MPNPSTVSAQDVSTELGKSTTTPLELNWANTRNIAVKSSGQISYGDCRWGINFPGGYVDGVVGSPTVFSYGKTYNTDANLTIQSYDTNFSLAAANSRLRLYSNGTLRMEVEVGGGSPSTFTKDVTWLTSGNASDYTAQLKINAGSFAAAGGDSSNTDLALSTDRIWWYSAVSGGGTATSYGNTEIIIKSGGTELFRRVVVFQAQAEAY